MSTDQITGLSSSIYLLSAYLTPSQAQKPAYPKIFRRGEFSVTTAVPNATTQSMNVGNPVL